MTGSISVKARGLPDEPAILFEGVTKRYRLGGGPREQLLEAFGLSRFLKRGPAPEFLALDDVSFRVERGRRMGLIGRNGAGKTTLLKLISGNFMPSNGHVSVAGSVQALMTMGQGFHPDYTGRENIRAALHYNGLSSGELASAFEDVSDFCELGPFIDQPFKTYSSGMQARLMFAAATAIKPDILVIDEVLGAGDAYFIAKSKRRVEQIVESGCTLLLVSHSMQQILELCEEVIWLDGGRVRERGAAFQVVKAYEEWMFGALVGTGDPSKARHAQRARVVEEPSPAVAEKASTAVSVGAATAVLDEQESDDERRDGIARPESGTFTPQIPAFIPHADKGNLPVVPDEQGRLLNNPATGGISRWAGETGLKIVGFTMSGPKGPTERLISLQQARFSIFLEAEINGNFACTYGLAIHDLQGRTVTRIFSAPDRFTAKAGDGRRVELVLNPNQVGPGIYTVGVSILGETSIENANSALRYDLLSRSFKLTVELPDSLQTMTAEFFHSGEWHFAPATLPASEALSA